MPLKKKEPSAFLFRNFPSFTLPPFPSSDQAVLESVIHHHHHFSCLIYIESEKRESHDFVFRILVTTRQKNIFLERKKLFEKTISHSASPPSPPFCDRIPFPTAPVLHDTFTTRPPLPHYPYSPRIFISSRGRKKEKQKKHNNKNRKPFSLFPFTPPPPLDLLLSRFFPEIPRSTQESAEKRKNKGGRERETRGAKKKERQQRERESENSERERVRKRERSFFFCFFASAFACAFHIYL